MAKHQVSGETFVGASANSAGSECADLVTALADRARTAGKQEARDRLLLLAWAAYDSVAASRR